MLTNKINGNTINLSQCTYESIVNMRQGTLANILTEMFICEKLFNFSSKKRE